VRCFAAVAAACVCGSLSDSLIRETGYATMQAQQATLEAATLLSNGEAEEAPDPLHVVADPPVGSQSTLPDVVCVTRQDLFLHGNFALLAELSRYAPGNLTVSAAE